LLQSLEFDIGVEKRPRVMSRGDALDAKNLLHRGILENGVVSKWDEIFPIVGQEPEPGFADARDLIDRSVYPMLF
jgi:hypothetical protein